jgi:hypothetical protein
VIPEGALSLSATKPGCATESFYLLNANSEVLLGTVALTRTSLPNTTNVTVVPPALSVPPPGVPSECLSNVESEGLHSRDYNLTGEIAVFTAFGLPASRSIVVTLAIQAKADPTTTQVFVRGSPTLGFGWGGISVVTFDSDGFQSWADSGGVEAW